MLTFILEAALRSLLVAGSVWAIMRLLRVQAVFAQKVAWILVLASAAVMPLVMHAPGLGMSRAIRIPLQSGWSESWLGKLLSHPAPVRQSATTSQSRVIEIPALRQTIPSRPTAPRAHHLDIVPSPTEGNRVLMIVSRPPEPQIQAVPTPKSTWTPQRLRRLAWTIYITIAGLFLVRLFFGFTLALRVLLRARPIPSPAVLGETSVRESRDLTTPVTIGSTVLLPSDWHTWDSAKLHVVLAHEQSHVRQRDFYLQLAAAIHAAIFWFSPLGWWLKRTLIELGEALGDRAGLAQAKDPAAYAQILLEFAAMPRTGPKTFPWRNPIAGVPMARSSNLSGRIERILNDRRFRLAFLGGRRHALLTALIVPTALIAVIACIRIVPAVKAAQEINPTHEKVRGQLKGKVTGTIQGDAEFAREAAQGRVEGNVKGNVTGKVEESLGNSIVNSLNNSALAQTPAIAALLSKADFLHLQAAPPVPPVTPAAPRAPEAAPAAEIEAPTAPDIAPEPPEAMVAPQAPEPPPAPGKHHGPHVWINHSGDDGDDFSIVHENGDGTTHWNGEYNDELAEARKKLNLRGDYIWFDHDGKSYVITDPAILAEANRLFAPNPDLERLQAKLQMQQDELNKRMEQFSPDKAKIDVDSPEMKKQMALLNAKLAELQSEKFKKLTTDMNKQINQEVLSDLQEKMGDIQSQIGEIQGRIGEGDGQAW